MKPTDFSRCLTGYLAEYLPTHRYLSANTIRSYSDVFRLLLRYCKDECGMNIDRLTLKQLDRPCMEEFLHWLSAARGNSVSTVNQRLAVIHAFFEYVRMEEPQLMLHCQKILEIRFRRAPKPAVAYLSADALEVILSLPDTSTPQGRRDLTMLALLYDTGARVQELADLTVRGIRLEAPASVTLCGKGRKTRVVPLMQQTKELLKNYFKEKRFDTVVDCDHPLFYNIRDFLGHVDVHTTEVYAKAEPEVKRKALEKAAELIQLPTQKSWVENTDLLDWLNSLSQGD